MTRRYLYASWLYTPCQRRASKSASWQQIGDQMPRWKASFQGRHDCACMALILSKVLGSTKAPSAVGTEDTAVTNVHKGRSLRPGFKALKCPRCRSSVDPGGERGPVTLKGQERVAC